MVTVWNPSIYLLCSCCFITGLAFLLNDDPCQTSLVLPAMVQRQENYTLKTGERELCDYFLVGGWYKMTNYTIATSNIKCGTNRSWHLNGSLPVYGTANISVCKDNGAGSICSEPKPVQVKRCSGESFAFYLRPTTTCPEAYCIEKLKPDLIADPCTTASLLPSLSQRLVGYSPMPGESRLCDLYLKEKWYKLLPGYTISTSIKTCGTTYPWHINGTLPTKPGYGKVTICKDNKVYDTCDERKTVGVVNCGNEEYIFRLPPTSACAEAYCIQSVRNRTGTGTTQASPTLPASVAPVVMGEVLKSSTGQNELFLYCDFNPVTGRHYFYTVSWFLSTRHLWSSLPLNNANRTSFRRNTALSENRLRLLGISHLGFEIVCDVVASYSPLSMPGPPKISPVKFIGIEVLNKTTVFLNDLQTANIYLRLTVPFGCPPGSSVCRLDINVFMPSAENCKANDVSLKSNQRNHCGVTFYNNETGVLKQITLQGKLGYHTMVPQGRHLIVRLVTHRNFSPHSLFASYFLDPIPVRLSTYTGGILIGKRCMYAVESHVMTFDGTYYENQYQGAFLLYKNDQFNVQIQIQTTRCPNYDSLRNRPWCNCGVVIAAGRDVFMINNCDRNLGWDIGFKQCEDGILFDKVFERGKNFEIQLPTGTEVDITLVPFGSTLSTFIYMNVKPSVYDYKATSGLCGVFDGNKSNDRAKRPGTTQTSPSLSWLVHGKDNLFEAQAYHILPAWDENESLCICGDNTNSVYGLTAEVTCDAGKVKHCLNSMYRKVNLQCSVTNGRRARDAVFDEVHDFHTSLETTHNYTDVHQREKMQVNRSARYPNVTARQNCLRTFNTTIFHMCRSVPDLDIQPYIDSCEKDVWMTDSMEWARLHLEVLKNHCKYQVEVNQPLPPKVLANPNYFDAVENCENGFKASQPNIEQFSPQFLAGIEELLCLNECSGNGVCVNGTCQCHSGFTDLDCSIDLSQPPIMRGIPDKGLCDLTQRLCQKTSVLGDNFAENGDLTCNIEPFWVQEDGSLLRGKSDKRPATRLTFAEVSCPLYSSRKSSIPPDDKDEYLARGYSISISNDGVQFGEADSIVVLDSTCVNCTKLGNKVFCMKAPSFCMKKGQCFSDGQTAGSQVCRASGSSVAAWMKDTGKVDQQLD